MHTMKYLFSVLGSILLPASVFAATLTLSPSSGTYAVGSVFSVGIYLNTENKETPAVDVEIRYPANLLQVVDANPSVSGTQITPGTLMPQVMLNTAENGRVRFGQIVPAGSPLYSSKNSSQLLATIPFRAVGQGAASVTFDYTPGSTRDSNVSLLGGIDLLSSVTNASFALFTSGQQCTQEAQLCPDGSAVGRTGPNCEFAACPSGGSAYNFSRNLRLGMSGEDVRELQKFLNGRGFLVASSDAGSPGNETMYFGGLTKSALIRFQEAYAAEILAPVGLARGSGYFGPSTRSKAQGLLRLTLPPQASLQAKSQIEQLQEQIRQAQEQVNRLQQQLQKTQ